MTPRSLMRGFTLLEVLVMMVIVSLISVVLMQGMGLILNLRDNLGDQMIDLDRAVLKRNLVRQPLQGLVPDFSGGASLFQGRADRVSGLTLQPLLRRPGRTIPFSLILDYDERDQINTLTYREDEDEPILLASWPGTRAQFRFIGDDTGWSKIWPPAQAPVSLTTTVIGDIAAPQLPELVYLATGSAQEQDYAVHILSRRNRIPRDPTF